MAANSIREFDTESFIFSACPCATLPSLIALEVGEPSFTVTADVAAVVSGRWMKSAQVTARPWNLFWKWNLTPRYSAA